MKRGLIIGTICSALVWTSVFARHVHLTGNVSDEISGSPIENAQISVFSHKYAPTPITHAFSLSSGDYFASLHSIGEDSVIFVSCSKEGYAPEFWNNVFSWDDAVPIRVPGPDSAGNSIIEGINFLLTPEDSVTGISGIVLEQRTNNLLGWATISAFVYPDTTIAVASTSTDSATGHYFLKLTPGQYYVKAEKADYLPEWYFEGNLTIVNVVEGQIISGISFTLEHIPYPGAISGVVVRAVDDWPIYGASVCISTVSGDTGYYTFTDASGFYKFENLKPDTYYAAAYAHGFEKMYWNNKQLLQDADPIVVTNFKVTGIDFCLGSDTIPGNVGIVTGIVTDASTGNPIHLAYVEIVDSFTLGGYTNMSGRYLIDKVPVGRTRRALAQKTGYMSQFSDLFEVRAGETVEINFVLHHDSHQAFGSISGMVVSEPGNYPIPGAYISVFPDTFPYAIAHAIADTTLYIVQDIPPGSYHVVARASGYTTEWYLNASDRKEASPVTVVANQNTGNINFTLSSLSTGAISGKVIDPDGKGIPFACVEAQGINTWTYGEAISDSMGNYLLDLLVPDQYRVSASAAGFRSGSHTGLVEVASDATVSGIDITLEPLPSQECKISGTVKDESTGEGIPFTLVIVFDPNQNYIGIGLTCDSSGAYEVCDVPCVQSPTYYVVAFPLLGSHIPEFYDNTLSWEEATLVPSNTVVNFALSRVGEYGPMAIKGKIAGERAEGISGAVIYAKEGDKCFSSARSYDDGSFIISKLPPGTYTLAVTRPGYKDVNYGPISVVETNVSGVTITLPSVGVEELPNPSCKSLGLTVKPNIVSHFATIAYRIPTDTHVELSVYDVSGRKVVTFVNHKVKAGDHLAILDTRTLTQGVYFVKLTADKERVVEKLILIR